MSWYVYWYSVEYSMYWCSVQYVLVFCRVCTGVLYTVFPQLLSQSVSDGWRFMARGKCEQQQSTHCTQIFCSHTHTHPRTLTHTYTGCIVVPSYRATSATDTYISDIIVYCHQYKLDTAYCIGYRISSQHKLGLYFIFRGKRTERFLSKDDIRKSH